MEWYQTKELQFKLDPEWAKKYFETSIKNYYLDFKTKKPIYETFDEWFEDYGYREGMKIFQLAKKDNAITDVQY